MNLKKKKRSPPKEEQTSPLWGLSARGSLAQNRGSGRQLRGLEAEAGPRNQEVQPQWETLQKGFISSQRRPRGHHKDPVHSSWVCKIVPESAPAPRPVLPPLGRPCTGPQQAGPQAGLDPKPRPAPPPQALWLLPAAPSSGDHCGGQPQVRRVPSAGSPHAPPPPLGGAGDLGAGPQAGGRGKGWGGGVHGMRSLLGCRLQPRSQDAPPLSRRKWQPGSPRRLAAPSGPTGVFTGLSPWRTWPPAAGEA